MTTPLRHRRRAERFAQLLDESGGGRRQHLRTPLDQELTDLVRIPHRLAASTPAVAEDREFRVGLRAMLMATAEREGIGATARPEPAEPVRAGGPLLPPVRVPRARTAVIAGVAVGAVAFAGMSTASENAMPGDALYGVKRSAERAQLALAGSDLGRGQLHLGFARTRLAEAQTLRTDLERVLDDMDRDTQQGVRLLTTAATGRRDQATLAVVDDFAGAQRTALERLEQRVTGTDQARVAASLDLLTAIQQRTRDLRTSLTGECEGRPVANLDALGPVPPECVALTPPRARDISPGLGSDDPTGTAETEPGTAGPEQPGGGTGGPSSGGGSTAPDATDPDRPAETSGGADGATGTSDPDQPAGETGTTAPPTSSSEEEPASTDDDEQTDDGGVLDGLNRLLGDLLGG